MNTVHEVLNELIRLETELWNELDDRLRAADGIGMNSYEPLRVIAATTDCRVQDIASALAITVGGTSKLVDRLVAAGLAERGVNPQDRRSSIVVLTDTGRATLTRARRTVEAELVRRLADPLSVEELAAFQQSLQRLRASFAETESKEVA